MTLPELTRRFNVCFCYRKERERTAMNMTKCLYNPVRECEYAECDYCEYYAEINNHTPDPDELFEIEREKML